MLGSWLRGTRYAYADILVVSFLCFLVVNVTNDTLAAAAASAGVHYGSDLSAADEADRISRYFFIPIKSLIFFLGTAYLLKDLARFLWQERRGIFARAPVLQTIAAMIINLALTATLLPSSFGRSYARISIDPFAQNVDQLYRRLLLPGLANLYHLDGVLYPALFWLIVFAAVRLTMFYMQSWGVVVSLLAETSLLSVGVFAACFQFPGYPEIVVLLLAVFALLAFERDGAFSGKQLAAFSLAMLAHEAAAIIMFGPLIVFVFGPRAWLSNGIVIALYVVALLANFNFSLVAPLEVQTNVSGVHAIDYLLKAPILAVLAAIFAFKAMWLFVPLYAFTPTSHARQREPLYVASGLLMAMYSVFIGVDYSRLIGFATIPVLMCFVAASQRYQPIFLKFVLCLNLLIPSLYVGGNSGVLVFRGVYGGVFGRFL